MTKLASIDIKGKQVAFFKPPHTEPDFPWVDVLQLASAFLPTDAAEHMLRSTQRYEDGKTVKTIIDGGRLTTIMCHAMAQGLVGAIDELHGHKEEDGPAFRLYCRQASKVAVEHWPMGVHSMIEAFHSPGGPFLRGKGGDDG
jgi:hypothetical protein